MKFDQYFVVRELGKRALLVELEAIEVSAAINGPGLRSCWGQHDGRIGIGL